jgi:hypothetical protein
MHALLESGFRNDGLTKEQMDAKDKEMLARKAAAAKVKLQNHHNFKDNDYAAFIITQRRYFANGNAELRQARKKRVVTKAVNEKRVACDLCDMPFPDQNHLNIYKSSQRHISQAKKQRKTAWDAANLANKKFHCAICDSSLPEKSSLNRHYRTKKHIGNVTAAISKSSSSLG